MRDLRLSAALAGIVAAYGLATSPVVHAAAEGSAYAAIPGGACQLSIPTTNTGVRPKATGFRNESTTTSNFVFCPLPYVNYSQAYEYKNVGVTVYSIDEEVHSVTCILAVGINGSSIPTMYSAKTVTVPGQAFYWTALDFGGTTSGNPIPGSSLSSVTCNLPPQTGITFVQTGFNYQPGT